MRDAGIFNFQRAMPRMSWSPKNFYNLWARTAFKGPKNYDIRFGRSHMTLFQQRWRSKAMVRAYHGDFINEKIFKRWYLPETLPDVRPRRAVAGDDKEQLAQFAKRKQREMDYEEEVKVKGMAPVGSLMFSEVERRIDVFLFRCCFVHSVYEARRLVIHGDVLLNGKKHTDANTRLAPGDMISVDPQAIRFFKPPPNDQYDDINEYEKRHPTEPKDVAPMEATESVSAHTEATPTEVAAKGEASAALAVSAETPFYLPHYASPWLFIPAYIEPNFATCSAVYIRHPTARPGYSEIPTPYDADGEIVRYAWEWYVKNRPRVRSVSQLARMPTDRALAQKVDIDEERRQFRKQVKHISAGGGLQHSH